MIRMMEAKDLDQVAAVWLSGNKEAHPFVPKQYWEENLPEVKKQPSAFYLMARAPGLCEV